MESKNSNLNSNSNSYEKKIVPEIMPQFFPEYLFIPPRQHYNRNNYNRYRSSSVSRVPHQKGNIQFRLSGRP